MLVPQYTSRPFLFRHPGEGRGPSCYVREPSEIGTLLLFLENSSAAAQWVPAFAGMTEKLHPICIKLTRPSAVREAEAARRAGLVWRSSGLTRTPRARN